MKPKRVWCWRWAWWRLPRLPLQVWTIPMYPGDARLPWYRRWL